MSWLAATEASDGRAAKYAGWTLEANLPRSCHLGHRLDHPSELTGVGARRVLDAAEVPLHSYARRVVGVGQLQPAAAVVIEAHDLPGHPGEVLQATVGR